MASFCLRASSATPGFGRARLQARLCNHAALAVLAWRSSSDISTCHAICSGTIGKKDIAVGVMGLKEQMANPMFVTKAADVRLKPRTTRVDLICRPILPTKCPDAQGGVGYGVDETQKVEDSWRVIGKPCSFSWSTKAFFWQAQTKLIKALG